MRRPSRARLFARALESRVVPAFITVNTTADTIAADGKVSLREALTFPADFDPERPFTIANFVSSADGRATLDGRSAPLSSEGDRAMFHTLRERVDAVIAGTVTLRTERYGRMIRDPDARERRVKSGNDPEPLACVITPPRRLSAGSFTLRKATPETPPRP